MKKLNLEERAWVIVTAPKVLDALMGKIARAPYSYANRETGRIEVVRLEPYNCLFNCRVLRDVYRHFHIITRPMPCALDIGNEEFCRRYQISGPPRNEAEVEEWAAAGAYTVRIGPIPGGARPRRFNGHLVLIADNSYFIDPSIQQASRPARGIRMSAPLIRPLSKDDALHKGEPSIVIGPTGLPIRVIPTPEARDYYGGEFNETPGWKNPCIPDLVTKITETMRRDLLKMRNREVRPPIPSTGDRSPPEPSGLDRE